MSSSLVAACGLYCGECRSYKKGRCPGCAGNEKATWCAVRTCCREHAWQTCAECTVVADPNDCKKLNNVIAKIFSLIFRSDRPGSLRLIREVGCEEYARRMTGQGTQCLKR